MQKFFLEKALSLNKFFPPFMELYCKLGLAKNKNELIKVLKKYWLINPNPNIEQCLENSFKESNALSKLKIISKILVKNNHLYYKHLILGKFKYKAKIWGHLKMISKNQLAINLQRMHITFYTKLKKI